MLHQKYQSSKEIPVEENSSIDSIGEIIMIEWKNLKENIKTEEVPLNTAGIT